MDPTEFIFNILISLGVNGMTDLLDKGFKKLWGKYRTPKEWEKLFLNLNAFTENENIREDLINKFEEAFSKKNLKRLAKDTKDISGYDFWIYSSKSNDKL